MMLLSKVEFSNLNYQLFKIYQTWDCAKYLGKTFIHLVTNITCTILYFFILKVIRINK
jgi:hypothetical protein